MLTASIEFPGEGPKPSPHKATCVFAKLRGNEKDTIVIDIRFRGVASPPVRVDLLLRDMFTFMEGRHAFAVTGDCVAARFDRGFMLSWRDGPSRLVKFHSAEDFASAVLGAVTECEVRDIQDRLQTLVAEPSRTDP